MTTVRPEESAEVYDLLYRLVHVVRREAIARGGVSGVAPGQLRFLRTLQRCEGAQRPGELATRLDVAPRSITTKVDLAEAAGLVERRPDPTDRRATLVALTDRGLALLDEVAVGRNQGLASRLDRLTPTERSVLTDLLTRLVEPDPSGTEAA